jgi:hypothetical protein
LPTDSVIRRRRRSTTTVAVRKHLAPVRALVWGGCNLVDHRGWAVDLLPLGDGAVQPDVRAFDVAVASAWLPPAMPAEGGPANPPGREGLLCPGALVRLLPVAPS